ncbi:MAG: glycosyltransferase family 9 protein [Deltaproteobacteria bacterium]|nr:glycosyltransferase family 9 protein [Deltaproteobacteria bacterium]
MSSLGTHDRVLVRLPSWLGDLVQAEPSLRALSAHLSTPPSLAGPAALLPLFDGLFPGAPRIPHRVRGAEQRTEWSGHDVALLFPGSFRSAWTAWRAGIPRRIGWSRDGRAALLTDRLTPPLERGATPLGLGRPGRGRRYLPRSFATSCVELLGLLGVSVADTRPRLPVADIPRARVLERLAALGLAESDDYLLVNTGARPGSAKAYPAERWALLIDLLADALDLPLVLVCGPGEEATLKQVQSRATRGRVLPFVDPVAGMGELLALCAGARVFLTADSGPRHVALAVGTPVVCVAGPTDPRHAADHLEDLRLVRREVACGPCHREVCPLVGPEHHACMLAIEPAELVDRTIELALVTG